MNLYLRNLKKEEENLNHLLSLSSIDFKILFLNLAALNLNAA